MSPRRVIGLLALGDSLTAGWNLRADEAFPARLRRVLAGRGIDVEVVNAGMSGNTSGEGLARLPTLLETRFDAAIVALGINDAFQGRDLDETYANLDRILSLLRERGVVVLLAGMRTTVMGQEVDERLRRLYPRLAEAHEVVFFPDFLAGVANTALTIDTIHPTADGVTVMVANILPSVLDLLDRVN